MIGLIKKLTDPVDEQNKIRQKKQTMRMQAGRRGESGVGSKMQREQMVNMHF